VNHPLFAFFYDPLMSLAERAALAGFRRKLLSRLQGDVLEIGAGTGVNFSYYPDGARVLAIEPDQAMLARARKRAHESEARITLELGGDERLAALPENAFDAIVCTLVLCTVPDPADMLKSARRLLRPGAALVVMEHVRSPGRLGIWQDRVRPAWSFVAAGCQINRDTKMLIADAGFDTSALHIERVPGGIIRDLLVGYSRTPSSGQNP
jgi:ubiquinone/menaquinone biosynthesis C-methylase UbiE